VDQRHPASPENERAAIAHTIAIGALRYFLLKFTRTAIIAFDFQGRTQFRGETGPYCQYAVVRARNIFRKLYELQPDFDLASLDNVNQAWRERFFSEPAKLALGNGVARGIGSAPKSKRRWPPKNRPSSQNMHSNSPRHSIFLPSPSCPH